MGISMSKSVQKDVTVLPRLGSGRFEVGCAEIMLSDSENDDDVGILSTIYYPSDSALTSDEQSQHPLWLPREEYIDGLADFRNSSSLWMRFMHRWFIGEKRIPARWHLALNNTVANYPVLIFSHGLSGCRHFYSIYCSSLASHGYVVAAVEHRDCSACWTYKFEIDKKTGERIEVPVKIRKLMPTDDEFQLRNGQLHKRIAECVKTLRVLEELNLGQYNSDRLTGKKLLLGKDFAWSQFKGRIDMCRIFIAGHSFGGATAVAAAAAFPAYFSAAVILDGWMFPIERELFTRVQQPVLFMNAENFQWEENVKDMLQVIENSKRSVLLTFNEALHHCFTDLPLLIPGMLCRWLGIQNLCDPVQCAEAIVELTAHFLKSYYEDSHSAFNLLTYEKIVTVGTKFASQTFLISA
ncbi:platelet-activating factor acetylhydrolase [Loa loa]|uniref:1-alkyl-2-acetylglycerophosphocholine esterase n=1 Tax=Loa loa TaxID=7209 RepID=A0A1I7VQA3_LOALO|nr:platelet-activating factor acetylhydrolase [Loa loa]EFO25648.1 platelet-activating factor acetylhydrolase [Loa loa]